MGKDQQLLFFDGLSYEIAAHLLCFAGVKIESLAGFGIEMPRSGADVSGEDNSEVIVFNAHQLVGGGMSAGNFNEYSVCGFEVAGQQMQLPTLAERQKIVGKIGGA